MASTSAAVSSSEASPLLPVEHEVDLAVGDCTYWAGPTFEVGQCGPDFVAGLLHRQRLRDI